MEYENKTLQTIQFPSASCNIELLDNGASLKLTFGSFVIELSDYHSQDCCESVYADFEAIKYYIPQIDARYNSLIIKSCPEMGFILHFVNDGSWGTDEKVLIPCYNEQNGYYNGQLELEIKANGVTCKIDITECNQDKID